MSITFLLLVHDDPRAVARLVERLRAPGHAFVIHVDRHAALAPFREAIPSRGDVHFVDEDRRIPCHWADWSISAAMLTLLAEAGRVARADWFQFLSGSDYPLLPASRIEAFYRSGAPRVAAWREITPDARTPLRLRLRVFGRRHVGNPAANARSRRALPWFRRWPLALLALVQAAIVLVLPRRAAPAGLRVWRGSQWAALSADEADAVQALAATPRGVEITAFLSRAVAPDELLLPTLLAAAGRLAGFAETRQAGVRHGTHWIDWRQGREPAALSPASIDEALASGLPFCRKFPPSATADGERLRERVDAAMREAMA